jgi:hypothetical protein
MERRESGQEESQDKGLATPNPQKPDPAEVLRSRGPEFEPQPEAITETPQPASQISDQTILPAPTGPADDITEDARQKSEAELTAEIEKSKQEDEQKLTELRQELQEMQRESGQKIEETSEAEQDVDYYQGMGQ